MIFRAESPAICAAGGGIAKKAGAALGLELLLGTAVPAISPVALQEKATAEGRTGGAPIEARDRFSCDWSTRPSDERVWASLGIAISSPSREAARTPRVSALVFLAPPNRTREMSADEFVHAEAHRARPPIGIVPLEIERALPCNELAQCVDDEAIGAARFSCKGVDDDGVAFAAFLAAQPRAAFDPLLRQGLGRQRPAEEPSNPSILINDEEKVSAGDLIEEHLRPFTELKLGESRLSAEKLDRQAQGGRRVFRPPRAEDGVIFRPRSLPGIMRS